ncbi:MAG TPA: hypothetical protein VJN43_14475 [Bryobacteraceae bacterium]|nr:hypothetical protein [Bryobacteraceae bacterium]
MAEDSATKKPEKLAFPVPLVAGAIVVVLGLGAWAVLDYQARRNPQQPPALTAEAKQYVRNLQLSDVQIKATESYMKQQVVEIIGKITNTGPRTAKVVELSCVFRDAYGRVVLRERVSIVGRTGPLSSGATKNFRLAFDTIPQSWNQSMPDLVIAGIVFD